MNAVFNLNNLISDNYLAKLRAKFEKDITWGGAVLESRISILKMLTAVGDFKTILDYGAGNSKFKKDWFNKYPNDNIEIFEFEPGRKELAVEPPECDVTICYDVLEHVERDKIAATMELIANKTKKIFYFSICKIKSYRNFDDGTNLHLTIENEDFWLKFINKYFEVYELKISSAHLWGVGVKKQ